jgi:hypothetical protein
LIVPLLKTSPRRRWVLLPGRRLLSLRRLLPPLLLLTIEWRWRTRHPWNLILLPHELLGLRRRRIPPLILLWLWRRIPRLILLDGSLRPRKWGVPWFRMPDPTPFFRHGSLEYFDVGFPRFFFALDLPKTDPHQLLLDSLKSTDSTNSFLI